MIGLIPASVAEEGSTDNFFLIQINVWEEVDYFGPEKYGVRTVMFRKLLFLKGLCYKKSELMLTYGALSCGTPSLVQDGRMSV